MFGFGYKTIHLFIDYGTTNLFDLLYANPEYKLVLLYKASNSGRSSYVQSQQSNPSYCLYFTARGLRMKE